MRVSSYALLAVVVVAAATAASVVPLAPELDAESPASAPTHVRRLAVGTSVTLPIAPRLQWGREDWQSGYCGETSLQTALLYYGNYVSAEYIRQAGGSCRVPASTELLLGTPEYNNAAAAMGLTIANHVSAATIANVPYFNFLKLHLSAGRPVVIGVFEQTPADAANEYDHIVPAIGFDADPSGKVTLVRYNGLFAPVTTNLALPTKTRAQCSAGVVNECIPGGGTAFATAILGNTDSGSKVPTNKLYRVQLTVNLNLEPDWGLEDNYHMAPVPIVPTAIISGLTAGRAYLLLRFNNVALLPKGGGDLYLDAAWTQSTRFVAVAATHTLVLPAISSDSMYFYRCIAA